MIEFICGLLAGLTVSVCLFGVFFAPKITESKLLIEKLRISLFYAEKRK